MSARAPSSVTTLHAGMSLFDAVNLIRKKRNDLSCVEVKYANQVLLDNPPLDLSSWPCLKTVAPLERILVLQVLFHQDIVINFPEHGFHLRFEPRSQRLRLIEVYDVTRLQVSTFLSCFASVFALYMPHMSSYTDALQDCVYVLLQKVSYCLAYKCNCVHLGHLQSLLLSSWGVIDPLLLLHLCCREEVWNEH